MSLLFQKMCRTCMVKELEPQEILTRNKVGMKTQMVSIFTAPEDSKERLCLIELLKTTLPMLKVEENDLLPKIVCLECSDKIRDIYRFQQNCLSVEQKFYERLEPRDAHDPLDNNDNVDIIKTILDDPLLEESSTEFDEYLLDYINMEAATKKAQSTDLVDDEKSGSDWEEEQISKNQTPSKISPKKQKRNFEIKNGPTSANNSNSIKTKQKVSKNRVAIADINIPTQNDDGSLTCPECDDVLDNVSLWQKHMHKHRLRKVSKRKYVGVNKKPRKTYKCEHCDKVFPKPTAYNNHVRIHTGEEPFLCIVCGKRFKVVAGLNAHMLRHKGEKRVQCPHCPKKFICSSGLYNHMMVHTKEKPYVCNICGSAFHMACHLKKHNLYHSKIKNYQCEYCDMRFVTGEKQRRHMRTHTGEKPYRCKYCERAFAQSNDCVKHLRQHLGDNVYQCELCPLRFPLARDLRVHFASHKDDNEDTRARNLEARMEEERNLQIKFGVVQKV